MDTLAPNLCVILVAAGKSSRFGDSKTKKPFVILRGDPVWLHSVRVFRQLSNVQQWIVVVAKDDEDQFRKSFQHWIESLKIEIVLGGPERADSVENAVRTVKPECDFVLIHDAARPCISFDLVQRVLERGQQIGAAIPAIPISSTMKYSSDGKTVDRTVDRTGTFLAQTPQIFRRDWILDAYQNRLGKSVTDDAQLVEEWGYPVSMVEGCPLNRKITTQKDLILADAFFESLRN